jgi:hypothetical protein
MKSIKKSPEILILTGFPSIFDRFLLDIVHFKKIEQIMSTYRQKEKGLGN